MQSKFNTDDLRICETKEVVAPVQVHDEIPMTETAANTILQARTDIHNVLTRSEEHTSELQSR